MSIIPTPEQMLNTTVESQEQRDDVYNSEEVMKNRQNICFSCQYYNSEEMKCNECGCPVIMMSQFNFKQCPKGYWE